MVFLMALILSSIVNVLLTTTFDKKLVLFQKAKYITEQHLFEKKNAQTKEKQITTTTNPKTLKTKQNPQLPPATSPFFLNLLSL